MANLPFNTLYDQVVPYLPGAEPGIIDPRARYQVQLRLWLDLSQLSRPLQIGAMGRSGWNLSLERSQRFAPESGR